MCTHSMPSDSATRAVYGSQMPSAGMKRGRAISSRNLTRGDEGVTTIILYLSNSYTIFRSEFFRAVFVDRLPHQRHRATARAQFLRRDEGGELAGDKQAGIGDLLR